MATAVLSLKDADKIARLQEIAYTPGGMVQWLFRPHTMLGGATAAQYILEGKVDEVLTLIDQLETGAFT